MFYCYNKTTKEVFYALTGGLLIFSGLESAWPGIVLAYFNINWLLILWLIVGMMLLFGKEKYN